MDVTVSHIGKAYARGAPGALRDISFTAHSQQITSLVGASGCGKTTTLRCIAGLESIDAGEIRFADRLVARPGQSLVPTAERNIGMVFQSYALWPHLTVAENLAFSLRTRRWSKQRIEARIREILELIDLPAFAGRYPAQLSGGQQQRVAVGRALAYDPAVLLLDEPLANLDSHLRAQMRQEIRDLQRRTGVTMIYVTHDRMEAMELSDSIVILDAGLVVQKGSPDELFKAPANALVARFVGHTNFIPATVVAREGALMSVDTVLGRCVVAGDANMGQQAVLLVRAEAIRLGAPTEAARDGWLAGRGRLVATNRTYGGAFCDLSCDGVTLELFVPDGELFAADDEVAFFIDPASCRLLSGSTRDE